MGLYKANGKENGNHYLGFRVWGYVRWTPHPVMVHMRDNGDDIRVLIYSCFATLVPQR